MKKKLIVLLLIFTGVLLITGCAADNKELNKDQNKKESLVDLEYYPPKETKDPIKLEYNSNKTISYQYREDTNKSISLTYVKGQDYKYIEDNNSNEIKEGEINGNTWKYFIEDGAGIETKTYYIVHNNDLYYIELNSYTKYANDFDTFMKDVSFKD